MIHKTSIWSLSVHNYNVANPINFLKKTLAHKEYKPIIFNTKLFWYYMTVTKAEKQKNDIFIFLANFVVHSIKEKKRGKNKRK